MIRPEKILSCSMCGNILSAVCGQGVMQIIPYGENLLHFVYYPDCNTASSKLPELRRCPCGELMQNRIWKSFRR